MIDQKNQDVVETHLHILNLAESKRSCADKVMVTCELATPCRLLRTARFGNELELSDLTRSRRLRHRLDRDFRERCAEERSDLVK